MSLETLPKPGNAARAKLGFERWRDLAGELDDPALASFVRGIAADGAGQALLAAVFGNSPYLSQSILREPAFLRDVIEGGAAPTFKALLERTVAEGDVATDLGGVMRLLRQAKRKAALAIALADVAGDWRLDEVTGALSRFADATLGVAVRFLLRQAAARGEIELAHRDDPERDSGLLIIGMGKLGAGELNYSSDIDLIVLYEDERIRYTGRKSVKECLVRLTLDLVKIMEERTADGYVFRTDLRLRPDPGATPPAISIAAAELYYEGFGQNWERAALIKARQVAGDRAVGDAFLKFLRPFIWRKNLDFAAIQDIHSIKRQINAHRGHHTIAVAGHNIKLGRGGIREIEFFAQTQQLIWGGRQPEMRPSGTCAALRALAAAGHIDDSVADQMIDAYSYLRRLEHRLQMIDDKQTQVLPGEAEQLAELAAFMGYDSPAAFETELRGQLECVEQHYAHLFEDAPNLGGAGGNLVFTGGENDPETLKTITEMGFSNATGISSQIRGWHHGRIRATRSTRARELLTELTPVLLTALSKTANPDAAFMRFDEFLSHLPAGVPVFSLFYANPGLLDLVAEVMGDAPRLAEHLSRNPSMLDSVLSEDFLAPPPPPEELDSDLDRVLADARDYQEILDLCRRWTNDRKFQVGMQTLRGLLDPAASSRALTDIADTVISRLHPRVEDEFARLHGRVPGAGVAIVAMGKMGGREMTATSDLDLIIIYEVPPEVEQSNGPKPLLPGVYFARLTQRLLNAITAKTGEGLLYEVDMRLRPSGHAGPIASSLEAFVRYHDEMAWTWEHMAMTRARVISGPPDLAERVRAVIDRTLCRPRDPDRLLRDVADMRARMAREHRGESLWDGKHVRGGLIDIEFITQYLLLRHAHAHPGILATNTAAMIERLRDARLLAKGDAALLIEALRLWSAVQAVLRLTIAGRFDEATAPEGLKSKLARAAGQQDFAALKRSLAVHGAEVRSLFAAIVDEPAQALALAPPGTQEESAR
ncbi:MAG: bifunctional [glutamine synthetase] adenylyltransferase/[glutamine synthetase]-adenylyl-L-tyrosine phosphorylase [Rhodospirillales bacterium]|nr:bifunctional [glutamine synthetase] adenylyltransferase/[glutamine synthetase]-adenylyl-L-tyrosine phosphorylase [Rhodospirillales bacterium]